MIGLKWQKPCKCDNSAPNCAEVAEGENGDRYIRDTKTRINSRSASRRMSGARWRVLSAPGSVSDAPVLGQPLRAGRRGQPAVPVPPLRIV